MTDTIEKVSIVFSYDEHIQENKVLNYEIGGWNDKLVRRFSDNIDSLVFRNSDRRLVLKSKEVISAYLMSNRLGYSNSLIFIKSDTAIEQKRKALISTVEDEEKILKFTFAKRSRVYHEFIEIRSDSTFVSYGHYYNLVEKKFPTSETTWERLNNLIGFYKLSELENLPSPTNDRSYDGALISGIMITTNLKKHFCGEFDDYNPNGILKPLLIAILENKK